MGDTQLRLEDFLSTAEAIEYVNARLAEAGEKPVSAATFRTHIHVPQYAQLEPIRLGAREMEDGSRRDTLFAFTPRLLDEYLANRPMNRGRDLARRRRLGGGRVVARPTAAEAAQVLDAPAAVEYVNERIAAAGGSYTLTLAMLRYYRDMAKLAYRPLSPVQGVYLRRDLDALAEFLLAEREPRPPVGEASPG